MQNFRNKQFISLEVSEVLSNMMKSASSHSGHEPSLSPACPHCVRYPPSSHLATLPISLSITILAHVQVTLILLNNGSLVQE